MKKSFFFAASLAALSAVPALAANGKKKAADLPQGSAVPILAEAARSPLAGGAAAVPKSAPPLYVNLYWSAALDAPQNMEGGIARDSSYAFGQGFSLSFDALELRWFNSCKKTGGADLWAVSDFSSYEKIFDRRRASLSVDFSKRQKYLQTKIALGSLKFYTQKRVAPFAASASPFASSPGDSGAFCASLPAKSSSPQDDALYVCASLKALEKIPAGNIRFMPLCAEFGISKNGEDEAMPPFSVSLRGGFFYQNILKATGGFFFSRYYGQSESSAEIDWFDDVFVLNRALFNAAAADLSIEIPYLKSRTTFSVAESQDSLGRAVLAEELYFGGRSLCLAAAFFASDNVFSQDKKPYVAANARECKKNWQAKITPQISFALKNGASLKIGAGAFFEERIYDFAKKTERDSVEGKLCAGGQISSKADSLKVAAGVGALTLEQSPGQEKPVPLPKWSATLFYSHRFAGAKGGRLSVSCAASFQPEREWEKREWTERLKIAYYPKNSFVSSASLSCSASQKGQKRALSPAASCALSFKAGTVRANASVSARFPFSF